MSPLSPLRLYAACMEELIERTSIVLSITSGALSIAGRDDSATELACIQLRKSLELLVFGSLVANKEKYAEAYSDFAQHWSARKLLKNLTRIHPDFYPRPVVLGPANGVTNHNFLDSIEPYLTQDDFAFLYGVTSEVLHARNPFRDDPRVIDFRLSVAEWVARIQSLLSTHYLRLVDSPDLWVVVMKSPQDGRVHVLRAEPIHGTQA